MKLNNIYELNVYQRRIYGEGDNKQGYAWFTVTNTQTKEVFNRFDPYPTPMTKEIKETILRIVTSTEQ